MRSLLLLCHRGRRRASWTVVTALLRGPALVVAPVVVVQHACTRNQAVTVSGEGVEYWFADPHARELAAAAAIGDAERVAALVEAGANPNAAGRDGMTPLVWALRARNLSGLRALLAHGANPNIQGPPGLTPLVVAAKTDNPELLAALLDARGNPNARNADGDPLLHTALMSDRPDNVRLLIGRGADLNAVDHGHTTLAVEAAGQSQWDVVALLLERGADPNIPDDVGSTVANTLEDEETGKVSGPPAQARNRERVRQLLVARGVHFPPEPAEVVRQRVFGPDKPTAGEQVVRNSLADNSAAGRRGP